MHRDFQKTLLKIHEDVPADHYDQGVKNNLFQKIWHNRRFKEVLKVIDSVDGVILDVGCHGGYFTEKILSKIKSKNIYGIDISLTAIDLARKRIPFGHFQVADAEELPFDDNFFDAIFCLEMLEHVDDPLKVLLEMNRVLKRGGIGIILVPTDNYLFKLIWFLWTWRYSVWKHAHVQSFSNSQLEQVLIQVGFKIKMIKKFNLNMLKIIVFEKP